MAIAILKTKLGIASTVGLTSFDGSKVVRAFPVSATGRALTFEESRGPGGQSFRGHYLASAGKYGKRRPFSAVWGVVGGRGRVLLYDRFGLAARWEGDKPLIHRRGLKFTARLDEILEDLLDQPLDLLGYPGAYKCPACRAAKVEAVPPAGYMSIPLCVKCLLSGGGERDWVGTWQCVQCGERVKDEVLECPLCARIATEQG